MPSNRAILADLAKYNLDPKVAHTTIHAHGRLGKNVAPPSQPPVQPVKVVTKPPTLPKIQDLEPVVVEVKVEEKVIEVKVDEKPVAKNNDEVVVDVTDSSKKKVKKIFEKA